MNGRRWLVVFLMLGGAARGAPVPPPPDGFTGNQYIDATGCVFQLQDARWIARMTGDQQLCGFPPSLAARRQDPTADRVLPLAPEPSPDPETLLLERLADGLRPGEWTADPRDPEPRAEPAPARRPDAVEVALRDAVDLAPALRAAGGITLSPDACARLGYHPGASASGGGAGLCPGEVLEPRLTVRHTAPAPAALKTAPAKKPATKAPDTSLPKGDPAPVRTARRAAPATSRAAPAPATEMIPPSARYVQVGAYADAENALIVLRTLSARGYKTGQSRSKGKDEALRVILAGPFVDRQSLIAALNDLRANGYPAAVAR